MNSKELFLNTCRRTAVPRTPVWLMRQVGRYMPSYRELRKRASFLDLLMNPALSAEAALSVIDLCDPDALILFSDILTIPAALGAEVTYEPKVGVKAPPRGELSFPPRDSWLSPAYEAIGILRRAAGEEKPIIGFAGGPYTLFSYLTGFSEGPEARAAPLRDEKAARATLETVAKAVALHLRRQFEAGADVLQIFDTHAGDLAPHHFSTFALEPLAMVAEELSSVSCPIILFARGRNHVEARDRLPRFILSVDWTVPLDAIPDRRNLVVQGNLDPAVLLAGPEVTRRETERMLAAAAGLGGHIANLGHGVLPGTPVESVQEFVATTKLHDVTHHV
jgi:uroporphyrinogen decarboxylase